MRRSDFGSQGVVEAGSIEPRNDRSRIRPLPVPMSRASGSKRIEKQTRPAAMGETTRKSNNPQGHEFALTLVEDNQRSMPLILHVRFQQFLV